MTDRLVTAIAQLNPTVGDIAGNIAKLRRAREEGARLGAHLVVGTELCVSGYPPEDLVLKPAFLDAFLAAAGIRLVPVETAHAAIALRARIVHGRGMGHGGRLNFGDAFSYALAKSLDAPLLFVGDDFTKTDVRSAMDAEAS